MNRRLFFRWFAGAAAVPAVLKTAGVEEAPKEFGPEDADPDVKTVWTTSRKAGKTEVTKTSWNEEAYRKL